VRRHTRTLQRLLASEDGFTLIELEIVCVIIGILTALAVPAYLQFRDNAYKKTASANVRAAVIAATSYGEDNFPGSARDPDRGVSTADSGYQGMNTTELKTYDSGLSPSVYVNNSGTDAAGVTTRAALDATHYCLYSVDGRWYAYQLNPTGSILVTTVASAVCT
jgi:type IV pilus assembly protein PilA